MFNSEFYDMLSGLLPPDAFLVFVVCCTVMGISAPFSVLLDVFFIDVGDFRDFGNGLHFTGLGYFNIGFVFHFN